MKLTTFIVIHMDLGRIEKRICFYPSLDKELRAAGNCSFVSTTPVCLISRTRTHTYVSEREIKYVVIEEVK